MDKNVKLLLQTHSLRSIGAIYLKIVMQNDSPLEIDLQASHDIQQSVLNYEMRLS